jgi:hypothetical protein
MKRNILESYALTVCFACVICFVAFSAAAGYSFVQIVKPDFTMSAYRFVDYQSNDTYWQTIKGAGGCSKEDKPAIRPSESELTKLRTEAFSLAKASEQRDGEQTLVKTLIVILVNALAFLIHWRIARSARS